MMLNYYGLAAVVAATILSMTLFSDRGLSADPESTRRPVVLDASMNCGPAASQTQAFRCMQAGQLGILD